MSGSGTFQIQTFGCKVNTYDTGLLQKRLQQAGYLSSHDGPKIHILNTCAVTREATQEAVRTIRKLKSQNPFCTVVVTGCAAQVDTDVFRNLPGADLVVANSHKGRLEEILKLHFRGELQEKVFHSNIFRKEDLEAGGGLEEGHTRGFLKIQDGCNSFCSYCVIPFARGKSRSIPVAELVRRLNELHEQGVREVVLTGVHIGDYEGEQGESLEDLIEAVLIRTKIARFRLTSLEPLEVTPRLLDLYSNSRLCPHFHMSIQSASTRTLTEMRRKYTADDVEHALNEIDRRSPESFVGMDVIVGFPGETDEDFEETYRRLDQTPWTRMHVFPYSERPGTKSARREDALPREVISARARRLRELSEERYVQRALEQVGEFKQVLVLRKKKDGSTEGLSRDFWPIRFEVSEDLQGQEVLVRVTGFDQSQKQRMNACLHGELQFRPAQDLSNQPSMNPEKTH